MSASALAPASTAAAAEPPTETTPLLAPPLAPATETTSLLPSSTSAATNAPVPPSSLAGSRFKPVRRLQLISYLMVLALSMPNTSLLYVMRQMSCDGYYAEPGHEWTGKGDKCHAPEVEGLAGANIAMMGTIQTVGGIVSIFVTQHWIARFGTKTAMFQGSIWSAVRMLTHVYGMMVGGSKGVTITLIAQLLCILGTPGGFMLATNSALMEMVAPEERTAMFGVLGGAQMAGFASGLLTGGLIYTKFGLYGPFIAAFILLVLVVMLGLAIIPYVAPAHKRLGADGKPHSKPNAFSAMKLFFPIRDDHGRRHWTLSLLILGVYTSVLATGYVGVALQLVGQDMFGFEPNKTSAMLFGSMAMRTIFLMAIFPRIIKSGRAWFASKLHAKDMEQEPTSSSSDASPEQDVTQVEPPVNNVAFDVHFLRLSILVDAILTGSVALVRRDWQLFLAAAILPFASGTGPAAKGVVTELVGAEHKQEALSAIALVESFATVSTVGIFGSVYAVFARMGMPQMVFAANAAVALVAFFIFVPVCFTPTRY